MQYRQCSKCVMDTTDPDIAFDNKGVCNHCRRYEIDEKQRQAEAGNLPLIFKKIKDSGKQYDCLIGLSGGVDSSLCLHYLVENGIKPLAFSIDNGWNDPRADENIMRLVEGMKVPFYRYTINLDRFKELQSAFIQSGTKNIEIPTDHILMASSLEMASKYGIKYIVSGGNLATESIMPAAWGYQPRDLVHIKAIYKKFAGKKLDGLPLCGLLKWNWYKWFKGIRTIYLLDYYEYNRAAAIKLLAEKYGYKEYGEKHCENIFTWWFQNYYLFEKFGIDKRKAHFSSLINSGQMTRHEALTELFKNPVYPELGIEKKVLKYPKHEYKDYPNDEKLWKSISILIRALRKPYRKLTSIGATIRG